MLHTTDSLRHHFKRQQKGFQTHQRQFVNVCSTGVLFVFINNKNNLHWAQKPSISPFIMDCTEPCMKTWHNGSTDKATARLTAALKECLYNIQPLPSPEKSHNALAKNCFIFAAFCKSFQGKPIPSGKDA